MKNVKARVVARNSSGVTSVLPLRMTDVIVQIAVPVKTGATWIPSLIHYRFVLITAA
jgi:hypothetical protein